MRSDMYSFNLSKHKIALFDHLKGLERVNILLDQDVDYKTKTKLKNAQKNHIKSIKSLTQHLNSIGKLKDSEVKNLLSLDLYNMKKFPYRFKIGRD